MTSAWIANGRPVHSVSIEDRGYLYGDGLFETIAIRGGAPRFWDSHLARLRISCERLGLSPPDAETLRADLAAALLAAEIDTSCATAKIVVTAGPGPRGYRRAANVATLHRVGAFAARPLAREHYAKGVTVRVCQTRIAAQPRLAGMKTLNRLEQVLARAEWTDPAIFEGLQLAADEHVICGTMSNVFIVTAGQVATPALTQGGVAGIMRQEVLSVLAAHETDCAVRNISLAELKAADEVFLTNSQFGLLPVQQLGSRRFAAGATTRNLMASLAQRGVVECAI